MKRDLACGAVQISKVLTEVKYENAKFPLVVSIYLFIPSRLKSMENTSNKLLFALKNSGAEWISEAYHWVQEHRHELKKPVYGPVLLEVYMFKIFIIMFILDHDIYLFL